MGYSFAIKGRLVFRTAEESQRAYEMLTSREESLFFRPSGAMSSELVVKKEHLVLKADNFASDAEALYATNAMLETLARVAWRGDVKVIEGDGVDGTVIGHHGALQKNWPAALRGKAKAKAEPAVKKKPAAKPAKPKPTARQAAARTKK